ncbi:hypothetical protein OsJ_05517 [Oryza sativa Japonica Group]|uniref:Uncharacterized protein n=1 Tax=Oryza sativa subsp. japonica TaxID=39947 RepID=B9F380_ORYSJ|nr:hypothetical protein OsJ_05517 [Oryza sativa Japonica Group]
MAGDGHGVEVDDVEWHRGGEGGGGAAKMGVAPVELVEAATVILALAAFLSAAGLLLLRHAAGDLGGHHRIVSPACSTAVLVASTAALFLASLGTVVLLLNDYQTVMY